MIKAAYLPKYDIFLEIQLLTHNKGNFYLQNFVRNEH